ncbi:hypothetical protein GCM10011393_37000 [Sphingopyxis bauzanensis]|nr:hypothetical protein GCM10011393_37000 [Sphingopyxis bauzanensis]
MALLIAPLLPLLTLRLSLLIIATLLLTDFAALLAHLAPLRALGAGLRLLTLNARFAAAVAAAGFRTARSAVAAGSTITVAALRQLYALARRLRGGRGNGRQDRRSDQQPSEHLFHLAILQLMSRMLERPAGMMNHVLPGAR